MGRTIEWNGHEREGVGVGERTGWNLRDSGFRMRQILGTRGLEPIRSAECGIRNSFFGVRSSEFVLRSSFFGVRSSEFVLRSSFFGVRSSEFVLRNGFLHSP